MFDFEALVDGGASDEESATCDSPPATVAVTRPIYQKVNSRCRGKLRVLCLHGHGSNTNIMKFQVLGLRKIFGHVSEFEFLNGGSIFKYENGPDPALDVLAEGMPYYKWYTNQGGVEDPSMTFTYEGVDEGIEHLLRKLKSSGPFDVLVGFSQGANIITMTAGALRKRNEAIPWRVNVLVGGVGVLDAKRQLDYHTPLDIPTVMVFGRSDVYYEFGTRVQVYQYKDANILEHEEGHKFPTRQPRANEIYEAVKSFVALHCD
eukprot:TRINITY_DN2397_c0_g4_i1.p1 TRINITY_DN2397_c0_g4~~TRINITY_DN2397_c0_g4_i1.p1  ORF type:complete len:261 (-),score=45.69 TRINITY_DN2397_c0_g4_i1:160-942(-)